MIRKKLLRKASAALVAFSALLLSCGEQRAASESEPAGEAVAAEPAPDAKLYDEISVGNSLNADWVKSGKGIYEMKCQSCHKLTDEKLVGPGWKGITQRRSPGWIVAMTTKPEVMLEQDAEAKKLFEEHLIKMPNQNISADEARQLLEFMRSNDGVK